MTTLKYKIEDIEKGNGVKIQFALSSLSKVLELERMPNYSAQMFSVFEKKTNNSSIQFYPTLGVELSETIKLKKYLEEVFKKVGCKKISESFFQESSNSLLELDKSINLSELIGCKVINNTNYAKFFQGSFFIFYDDLTKGKKIMETVKNLVAEKVLYSLEKVVEKTKIKLNKQKQDFSLIEEFLQFFIKRKTIMIQEIGKKFSLCVQGLKYHKKTEKSEPLWSLQLHLTGNRYNMNQFYFELEELINSCKFEIIKIEKVECSQKKANEILPDSYKLLNSRMIFVIDEQNRHDHYDIIRKLQTERRKVGFETFSVEQLQILFGQWERKQFRCFLQASKVQYHSIDIRKEQIIIECDNRNLKRFKQQSKKFLAEYKNHTSIVDELPNTFLIETFLEYYQEDCKQKYMIEFEKNKGKLQKTNYIKDEDKINSYISDIQRIILSRILIIPSLEPVDRKKFKNKRYVQTKNPQRLKCQHLGSSKFLLNKQCSIFVTSSQNFINRNQTMIFLVNQDDLNGDYSILFDLLGENEIIKFLDRASSKKNIRSLSKYIDHDFQFGNIVLFYTGLNIRQNGLEEQMNKLFHDHEKDKEIHIMTSTLRNSNFEEFLRILVRKQKEKKLQCESIFLYYQNKYIFEKILQNLKRVKEDFREGSVESVNKFSLNQWDILRAESLQYFQLKITYKEQTKILPGLASYIFHNQIFKNKSKKCLFCLPIDNQYPIQFLVNLQENIMFYIDSFKLIQRRKPDPKIQRYIQIITHYFQNIKHIVIFARNSEENNLQYCENLYLTTNQNQFLSEVIINLNEKTLGKGTQTVKYHLSQKKDTTKYQFLILPQDAQSFLEAIKQ